MRCDHELISVMFGSGVSRFVCIKCRMEFLETKPRLLPHNTQLNTYDSKGIRH